MICKCNSNSYQKTQALIFNVFLEKTCTLIPLSKIYKYVTARSKSVCYDKLLKLVADYNYIVHKTIKMKPVDVKPATYINFGIRFNIKKIRFDVVNEVPISKYRISFSKRHKFKWKKSFKKKL